MPVLRFYQHPGLSEGKCRQCQTTLQQIVPNGIVKYVKTEYCYYVELEHDRSDLTLEENQKLLWILSAGFEDEVSPNSQLQLGNENTIFIEIGPRLNFSTPFSTNAVSICSSIQLEFISRIERSTRYLIYVQPSVEKVNALKQVQKDFTAALHDQMTECCYQVPLQTFKLPHSPEPWQEVHILQEGKAALENVSKQMGLSFDEWDLDYYTELFLNKLKRNPTSVECFDMAQSNSEHSRHWFFGGKLIINGKEIDGSLFKMLKKTLDSSNQNNVIKFSDNSSAIQGYDVKILQPKSSATCSSFNVHDCKRHIIFTAETHNFPTGVSPFSGAATGTGGRIRDVQAAGRGAHVIAGTAAYCFGNLNIQGYRLPWEDESFDYPSNLARPVDVIVEASNGASDYGNKFGEPVISGFARSFGLRLPNGERREWVKPIMFSGGIGTITDNMVNKLEPVKGMEVVKIGGPVYRIGVGGGAASSVHVQGDQKVELDFGAVQRGDAEMEQKLNRVIRACIESDRGNPICSIHDQGAGGNGNVLKELVEPAGAVIFTANFQLGDPTIDTLELWGAEYQESNAILLQPEDKHTLQQIASREKCQVSFVGSVTGNGKVVLVEKEHAQRHPVDLELSCVLGSMPQKVFKLDMVRSKLHPLILPPDLTVSLALQRVLRLPAVGSKRYLTNKVDRSVTGLVAQQQCVGPLHTPLADVAVIALSYFETVGAATSIGEQPIKGLVDPAAGARMSVAEAITNMMFARITSLQDVKCSGNWMWPAKLPGEGAALYEACKAMSEVMAELGIAVDGGKDSLSMAARVSSEIVKAPGALVISTYVPCPDILATVTPDLKCPDGKGHLLYVDISNGRYRLGATALAQCYKQLGDSVADLENPKLLRDAFEVTQQLLADKLISAGHDISDGGLIVCLLEMAFAGNYGLDVNVFAANPSFSPVRILFAEEVGWVIETSPANADRVVNAYRERRIPCQRIGHSTLGNEIKLCVNGSEVLRDEMTVLRDIWEELSFQLEMRQANPECVEEEKKGLCKRKSPPYRLTFDPIAIPFDIARSTRVAVIREEGTNGDREMVASLYMAGFEVWDVTMTDLLMSRTSLDAFRGIVFPGGFSYADVLGSAKGWAASFLFDQKLKAQLSEFRDRPDTFSLGVCNGCQLLALLGWVAPSFSEEETREQGVIVTHNISERYESRFVSVRIENSPAIMLRDMSDSILGVWVAHGEGRFVFKNSTIQEETEERQLVCLKYVDDCGEPTTVYPYNPNGSVGAIAALTSQDGRHLAMMPHPERCIQLWQWPWRPQEWNQMEVSPWQKMFINAYQWCCKH